MVAVSLLLHVDLKILVDSVQVVKEVPQLVRTVGLDDEVSSTYWDQQRGETEAGRSQDLAGEPHDIFKMST